MKFEIMRSVRSIMRMCNICGCFLLVLFFQIVSVCSASGEDAISHLDAWGFPVGEELEYSISWGAIPVARAVVGANWKEGSEGELLLLWLNVRSNRAIALIYPVTIKIESCVRADNFMPVWFKQNRREGRRRTNEETYFDYENGKAIWRSLQKKEKKEIPLEEGTRDLFSFLYYLRRIPFELGSNTHHRVLTDDKIYDLWIQVAEDEIKESSLFADPVPAVEITPKAAFEGVFRREGSMEIKVSRDQRQLTLYMRANIPIGSIRAVLKDVRGPGEDSWGRLEGDAD